MATRCDVPKSDGDVPGAGPLSADCLSILDALDLPIVLVRRDFTIGRFNPTFSTHFRKCRVFEVYTSGRRINTRGLVSNWL